MKHTQGPWTVEKHAAFGWTIRAFRERHLGEGTLLCQLSGYDAGADACLIAAAPLMLEALERIEAGCCFPEDAVQRAVRDTARGAIAKAKGE